MANYSCKKFFSTTLKLSYNTSVTDRQTKGRQPCQYLDSYLSVVGYKVKVQNKYAVFE